MESREHFEARAAFEHAAEANNSVAKLVRLKYAHERALQKANEKAMFWQAVAVFVLGLFILTVITVL